MKSIIQTEKECYFCGATVGLECHHILFGTALRKIADKHGFKVWLCLFHHRDNKYGVHGNKELDVKLKRVCQRKYEEKHTREQWMALVGRNYL